MLALALETGRVVANADGETKAKPEPDPHSRVLTGRADRLKAQLSVAAMKEPDIPIVKEDHLNKLRQVEHEQKARKVPFEQCKGCKTANEGRSEGFMQIDKSIEVQEAALIHAEETP